MAAKKSSTPVVDTEANTKALKGIVNANDFAGRKGIAQKVFSVVCECPIVQDRDIPENVLKASIANKMKFVKEVATKEGDSVIRENIVSLAEILISPVKKVETKKKKTVKADAALEVAPMKIKDLRKAALDLVLRQTARSRVGLETEKEIGLSPKAAEIQNFFDENRSAFGCQTQLVARSVSAYIGEKIVRPGSDDDDSESFENFFAHGLVEEDGDIFMITYLHPGDGETHGINASGDGIEAGNDCRPATDAEVREFINNINNDNLRAFFSFLEVL